MFMKACMYVCAYKLFISPTNQFDIVSVDGCPFGVPVHMECVCVVKPTAQLLTVI